MIWGDLYWSMAFSVVCSNQVKYGDMSQYTNGGLSIKLDLVSRIMMNSISGTTLGSKLLDLKVTG